MRLQSDKGNKVNISLRYEKDMGDSHRFATATDPIIYVTKNKTSPDDIQVYIEGHKEWCLGSMGDTLLPDNITLLPSETSGEDVKLFESQDYVSFQEETEDGNTKAYFLSYLFQTPYLRPVAAYERAKEVANRHNINSKEGPSNSCQRYRKENKTRLPYLQWPIPGLWTLLSFIPFTPQQKIRITFAREVRDYEEHLAYELRHKSTKDKNGEEIADIQRLHPWTAGIQYADNSKGQPRKSKSLKKTTALSQQRILNVLYRLGIYGGFLLSAAVVTATLVVLMATGVFGPAAAAFITDLSITTFVNFLVTTLPASVPVLITMLAATAVTGILAIQEVCFSGSLARVFAKTLAQLVKTQSFLTKVMGENLNSKVTAPILGQLLNSLAIAIAGLLCSLFFSPLSAFAWSWSDRVGHDEKPRKLHEIRRGKIRREAQFLIAFRDFIPTSDMGDYSLIRTLLNPFQLAQMTLTWLTLSTFMMTDFIGGIGGPFRWVNNAFQALAYTLYAGAFLWLEPFKQLTGAVVARPVDTVVDAMWAKGYKLANRTPTYQLYDDKQGSTHNSYCEAVPPSVGNSTGKVETEKTSSLFAKITNNLDTGKKKLVASFNRQKAEIDEAGGMLSWIKAKLPFTSKGSKYRLYDDA